MKLSRRKLRQIIKEEIKSLREGQFIDHKELPRNVTEAVKHLGIPLRMFDEILREPMDMGPDMYILAIERSNYTINPTVLKRAEREGLKEVKFYANEGMLEFWFDGRG